MRLVIISAGLRLALGQTNTPTARPTWPWHNPEYKAELTKDEVLDRVKKDLKAISEGKHRFQPFFSAVIAKGKMDSRLKAPVKEELEGSGRSAPAEQLKEGDLNEIAAKYMREVCKKKSELEHLCFIDVDPKMTPTSPKMS